MNISSLGNVPNITNQITIGTPQAGFRCDPSAAATSGSGTSQGSARLLHLDLSDRKGYREDYSIRDAAEGLWNRLMEQIGKPSSLGSSAYQKYADSWRDFFAAIGGGGVNIRA